MINFTTAGESHGRALVSILEGIPAGLAIVAEDVDGELRRRMAGHGRGARMKIESDSVSFLSGVRAGETLGSPIAMSIDNRDWEHWSDVMAPEPNESGDNSRRRKLKRPRPGHADLVGVLKYHRRDARDILERSSARETASRVACGAVCKKLLSSFGVSIGSHVVELGTTKANSAGELPQSINEIADLSPVRCLDEEASARMVEEIDAAKKAGDTLGGIAEVVITGVVAGLGSHLSWDRRLNARLAGALMSIQAIKGVEIGIGFEAARRRGSEVHDEIVRCEDEKSGLFGRGSNRAGGFEGGMTTGQPIVFRVAMKPISTLRKPLKTVNLETGEEAKAQAERSDVTAVPAMGVVSEAMVALVLADAMVEKFGGDSIIEMNENFEAYMARMKALFSF